MRIHSLLLLIVYGLLGHRSWAFTSHSLCSRTSRTQSPSVLSSPLFLAASNEAPRRPNPLKRLVRQVKTRFQSLSRIRKILLVQMTIVLVLFAGITATRPTPTKPVEISYSSFLELVETQKSADTPKLERLMIGDRISFDLVPKGSQTVLRNSRGQTKAIAPNGLSAYTRRVLAPTELLDTLRQSGIPFAAAPAPRTSTLALTLRAFVVSFYCLILWRLYRSVSGNSKDATPGRLASNLPLASFDDIQGVDDAKQEVMELVDTLRNPSKYAILGARAPTGLLLEGPPGTGKTLLARATAASAGVPLLYCSGSDFVEMFVGRGAARVRKLFERATKLSPCIIFVDELDALGKSRDSGFGPMGRSNDEAEQTLNQCVVLDARWSDWMTFSHSRPPQTLGMHGWSRQHPTHLRLGCDEPS